MLRGHAVTALVLALVLGCAPAWAQVDGEQHTPGSACTFGATAGHGNAPDWDTIFECNGSTQWQRGAYFFGSSSDTCDSNHAGLVQWTGSIFKGCNGSSWIGIGVGSNEPAAFSFTNQTNVGTGSTVASNAVTLSGFTGALPAACTGCTAIGRNGTWGGISDSFLSGDTIAIELTASSSISTTTTASVTVGQVTSSTWSVTTGSTSYSGPGDVVSGSLAWWGLRAYSHAYANSGGKAINIRRASDNTTEDIDVLGSGALDVATASSFCTSTTCYVTIAYDQSGSNNYYAAPSSGLQPQLVFSCIGSLPCLQFAGGQLLTTATGLTYAQPYTFEAAVDRTTVGSYAAAMDCGSTQGFLGWANSANTFQVQSTGGGGDAVNGTMSDSTWHAFQSVFNNGSAGAVYVDSTATSKTFNTTACSSGGISSGATYNSGTTNFFLTGKMTEGGIWPSAFTSTQAGNMSTNVHSYWGF